MDQIKWGLARSMGLQGSEVVLGRRNGECVNIDDSVRDLNDRHGPTPFELKVVLKLGEFPDRDALEEKATTHLRWQRERWDKWREERRE